MLIFAAHFCSSQTNQVTVVGNLPQEYGGEYVSFSKPIGKFSTVSYYVNNSDNAVLKGNKFIKTLDISGPGLINLFEKPFNGMDSALFFAAPGDTIYVERQNGEIIFKGKNAIVNKMYSDIKLAPVAFQDEVYNLFKNHSDKMIERINDLKKEHFKFYDALYQKKQISESCLEYTKAVIERCILIHVWAIATNDGFRAEQKMPMSEKEADKIIDYVNSKYLPYKEEHLRLPFYLGRIATTALYFEKKAIQENVKIPRFWNQFDDVFQTHIDNIGIFDYLESNDYKESAIGQYFLNLIRSYDEEKTIKYQDLIRVYKVFAEKFPTSAYNVPLAESIMNIGLNKINIKAVAVAKAEPKVPQGSLAIYTTTLEPVGDVPFAHSNQSLVDALAEKFPNQNVFIDFWATWCGPCIAQFSYNKDLHTFLEGRNIKTLYLSPDENAAKWEKYIQDYNLSGYHFLPDKAYQNKFLKLWGDAIPIYLIYNFKTREIKKLEGLPKEKEKFYNLIADALKG